MSNPSSENKEFDARAFSDVLGTFPTGVCVLTARTLLAKIWALRSVRSNAFRLTLLSHCSASAELLTVCPNGKMRGFRDQCPDPEASPPFNEIRNRSERQIERRPVRAWIERPTDSCGCGRFLALPSIRAARRRRPPSIHRARCEIQHEAKTFALGALHGKILRT